MKPTISFSLKLALALVVGQLFFACSDSQDYLTNIEHYRNEKDVWLSTDLESPFVKKHNPFKRLAYYDINEKLRIETDLLRTTEKDSIEIVTNLGEIRVYMVFGTVEFKINDQTCKLILLTEDNRNLFIPFADITSGETTYGGGRYIETKIPSGNTITIDFNLAFNPYCAYVEGYSCPLPPKSNVLKVAIEAGEKNYIP